MHLLEFVFLLLIHGFKVRLVGVLLEEVFILLLLVLLPLFHLFVDLYPVVFGILVLLLILKLLIEFCPLGRPILVSLLDQVILDLLVLGFEVGLNRFLVHHPL